MAGNPSYSTGYTAMGDLYHNPSFRALTMEEMQTNAIAIRNLMLPDGWTLNAICGMLGNMQSESTINPGRWEGNIYQPVENPYKLKGLGLVQWTKWTKLTDWADARGLDWYSMDTQVGRINYEVANNLQWGTYYPGGTRYPITFKEFKVSLLSPRWLAEAFLMNYERPASGEASKPGRGDKAMYWWDFLGGTIPTDPENPDEPEFPEEPEGGGDPEWEEWWAWKQRQMNIVLMGRKYF